MSTLQLEALRSEVARLQKDQSELGDRIAELTAENAVLRREREAARLALGAALVDLGYTRVEAASRAKTTVSALRKYRDPQKSP